MIKDKTIKFGYGTVSVGSDPILGCIIFQQIKPPQGCGTVLDPENTNVEFIGEKIDIYLNCNKQSKFINYLNDVERLKIKTFCFDGYTFDFTNLNFNSIEVCKKHSLNAIKYELMCIAC